MHERPPIGGCNTLQTQRATTAATHLQSTHTIPKQTLLPLQRVITTQRELRRAPTTTPPRLLLLLLAQP